MPSPTSFWSSASSAAMMQVVASSSNWAEVMRSSVRGWIIVSVLEDL